MNCASTKKQQSTTTTPINNTGPAPFTSKSSSPLLVTSSIDHRNNVANLDSSIITTAIATECTDVKKKRPTPPPRSGRTQKINSATALAQQTLM